MINNKEDLYNTYIKNDNGELLRLYVEKCLSFGFVLSPAFSGKKLLDESFNYAVLGIDGDCVWAVSMNHREMKRELTLEDLTPQTNIETPEEKEALDDINSKLIKLREPYQPVITKVEWGGAGLPAVGVECEAVFIEHEHKGYGKFLILGYHDNYVWMEYIGELSNKSKHYTAKVDMVKFRKTETEAERVERERDEFKVEICKDLEIEAVGCNTACIINKLYELGYRKDSE